MTPKRPDATPPAKTLHAISLRLAASVALLLTGMPAQSQLAPIQTLPPIAICPPPGKDERALCPDFEIFSREGSDAVMLAFATRNFEQLEQLYGQWCSGRDRFPDGRWKLSQYGDALFSSYEGWKTWEKDLGKIKAWQRTYPQSEAAVYAEAIYWRAYAWKARGSGYANTVSEEGWQIFRERLTKARDTLDSLKKSGTRCAATYPLEMSVLIELNASEDEVRAVFNEGIKRFPEYHSIYFSMAKHYNPLWGGSVAHYERFASEAARLTSQFEGMGMYARIYWLVDGHQGIPFSENSQRPPHWEKLRRGYEDLMRKYPTSMHNLGKFVGVACRTSDSTLYRSLRAQISGYEDSADLLDPIEVCDERHQWASTAK